MTAATLADLAQAQHTDEAAAYEDTVTRQAVGDSDSHMEELLATAAGLWVAAFGSVAAVGAGKELAEFLATVTAKVEQALAGLGRRAVRALRKAMPGALKLGVRQAQAFARAAGHPPRAAGRGARAHPDTGRVLDRLERTVETQIGRALALLDPGLVEGQPFGLVAAALGVARAAIARVRTAVAWLVHQAVNTGARAVADDLGFGRIWIAELDACVNCAAYSGQVAGPGEDFDGGRSFDPLQRGSGPDAIDGPPLHPACRCRAVPWSPEWRRAAGLPDFLQQQAAESVALGNALPSESGAARIRAARSLLASGRTLPPRVAAKARRAVREGHFDRTAPTG
jgi:hypothetical protein